MHAEMLNIQTHIQDYAFLFLLNSRGHLRNIHQDIREKIQKGRVNS